MGKTVSLTAQSSESYLELSLRGDGWGSAFDFIKPGAASQAVINFCMDIAKMKDDECAESL